MGASGVGLILFGVLAEIISGALFRNFFDWEHPDHRVTSSQRRTKLRISRVSLVVGVWLAILAITARLL